MLTEREKAVLTNTPRAGETPEQIAARFRHPVQHAILEKEGITGPTGPMCSDAAGRPSILVEREKTHGSFETNADRSQHLKELFARWGYRDFCNVHKEALDMIALKLSRIFSGQAMHKDHWLDCAGYSNLAAEACDDNKTAR